MAKKNIKDILEKVETGDYSTEQEQLAKAWLFHLNQDKELRLSDEKLIEVSDRMWATIEQSRGSNAVKSKQFRLWPRIGIAAAVAIVVFTCGLFVYKAMQDYASETVVYSNDIDPGQNGATLTLSNGQKISIKDALTGKIASETGVKISKTAKGEIIYEIMDNSKQQVGYNTLSTSRGEQTRVRLPDGTLVFLNAESSLEYPVNFANASNREVKLIGEGYFEVTKDKEHPFIVESAGQRVEVIGTQFNISSYQNEPAVSTTLVEGIVKVNEKVLKPKQQFVLKKDKFQIKEVDIDQVVAWKNGEFLFEDESLSSIMRKIERWYDVQVVYDDAVDQEKLYWGGVSRYDKVSKVLDKLALTGNIHFKVEGRRIRVMK